MIVQQIQNKYPIIGTNSTPSDSSKRIKPGSYSFNNIPEGTLIVKNDIPITQNEVNGVVQTLDQLSNNYKEFLGPNLTVFIGQRKEVGDKEAVGSACRLTGTIKMYKESLKEENVFSVLTHEMGHLFYNLFDEYAKSICPEKLDGLKKLHTELQTKCLKEELKRILQREITDVDIEKVVNEIPVEGLDPRLQETLEYYTNRREVFAEFFLYNMEEKLGLNTTTEEDDYRKELLKNFFSPLYEEYKKAVLNDNELIECLTQLDRKNTQEFYARHEANKLKIVLSLEQQNIGSFDPRKQKEIEEAVSAVLATSSTKIIETEQALTYAFYETFFAGFVERIKAVEPNKFTEALGDLMDNYPSFPNCSVEEIKDDTTKFSGLMQPTKDLLPEIEIFLRLNRDLKEIEKWNFGKVGSGEIDSGYIGCCLKQIVHGELDKHDFDLFNVEYKLISSI